MKQKILISLTFSLLLFASCSSTKHSTLDTTNIREATGTSSNQVVHSINSATEIDVLIADNKEIVTEEFDTSQPVDLLTGCPPLKKRVTERSVNNQAQKERTTTTINTAESTVEDSAITNRTAIKSTDKEESRPVIIRVLVISALCAFLLILVYILIFYIYKQWQRKKQQQPRQQ